MSGSGLYKARRTAKSDPALGRQALFSAEINQRLAAELPPEVRVILHFTGETMPAQWLEAVRQTARAAAVATRASRWTSRASHRPWPRSFPGGSRGRCNWA